MKGAIMKLSKLNWIIVLVGMLILLSMYIGGSTYYIFGQGVLILVIYILIYITKEVESNLRISFVVLMIIHVWFYINYFSSPEALVILFNIFVQLALLIPFIFLFVSLSQKSKKQKMMIFIITSPLFYTFILFTIEKIEIYF